MCAKARIRRYQVERLINELNQKVLDPTNEYGNLRKEFLKITNCQCWVIDFIVHYANGEKTIITPLPLGVNLAVAMENLSYKIEFRSVLK